MHLHTNDRKQYNTLSVQCFFAPVHAFVWLTHFFCFSCSALLFLIEIGIYIVLVFIYELVSAKVCVSNRFTRFFFCQNVTLTHILWVTQWHNGGNNKRKRALSTRTTIKRRRKKHRKLQCQHQQIHIWANQVVYFMPIQMHSRMFYAFYLVFFSFILVTSANSFIYLWRFLFVEKLLRQK